MASCHLSGKFTALFQSSSPEKKPDHPVSLRSKVLERLVYNKIIAHFNVSTSFPHSQFGFLKSCSTLQQLLVNSNTQTDVIYLRKAFDSVCYTYLLNKLHPFDITGRLCNWFKCYSVGRLQRTKISNCSSSSVTVLSGVPQGSILGPFLFIVYIPSQSDILCVIFETACFLLQMTPSATNKYLIQSISLRSAI